MSKRVFITGATGFAGSYLTKHLIDNGYDVFGLARTDSHKRLLEGTEACCMLTGNLLDKGSLVEALSSAKPEIVYHLAGQADVGKSWKIPVKTIEINTIGTLNLLEAAAETGVGRLIIVTTADVYGPLPKSAVPITEKSVPNPYHPYAVSKVAASNLLPIYARRYGYDVIEVRPFNHIGPKQSLGFVVPDFASQIAAIKLKQASRRLMVGNLSAERDFTDVRDIVRAYAELGEHGVPGEMYLVSSGQPVAISYLMTALAEIADVEVELEYDQARMRPSDTPVLYGNPSKIYEATGWRPEIHLRQTLSEVLDEWLAKLSETKA